MAYANKANQSVNTVSNNQPADSQTVFENTWSLAEFAKMFVGNPRRETANYKNGELQVKGLRFENAEGKYTFVAFAKSLGDVTNDDLKKGKNGEINLKVGENAEGFYYLFRSTSVQYDLGEEIDW